MKVTHALLMAVFPVVLLGCSRKNDDSGLTDEQLLRKSSEVIAKNPGEGELLYLKYEERQQKKDPVSYEKQHALIFKAASSSSKEEKISHYRDALAVKPQDNGVKFSLAMNLKNGNEKEKEEARTLFAQIIDSKDGVYDVHAKKMKAKL
jgi:hypothetical protein